MLGARHFLHSILRTFFDTNICGRRKVRLLGKPGKAYTVQESAPDWCRFSQLSSALQNPLSRPSGSDDANTYALS